jgi:hypothetical protein
MLVSGIKNSIPCDVSFPQPIPIIYERKKLFIKGT